MAINTTVTQTPVHVGDIVRLHLKIVEGEKERVQIYEGMIIGIKGRAENQTMTVRKISSGIGVERIFPVHSPWILKTEVKKTGRVRRAKLTYVRKQSAKQVAQITKTTN